MTTNNIDKLTKDQQDAFEAITHWLSDPHKQYLTLGGYAGTGKTTLISYLKKHLNSHEKYKNYKIAFCCYTGKAANVLKQKLDRLDVLLPKDSCSTIHRLIYKPIIGENGNIIGWERVNEIPHDLIIIDEASMVNKEIWDDLASYQKPILVVGDHGQLPPVEGSFNLMENPEIKLESIVRQALDNPIIKLSMVIRQGGDIPFGNFGEKVYKLSKSDGDTRQAVEKLLTNFNDDYLVLCAFNKTRVMLNNKIRKLQGFIDPRPQTKERVICLKNNYKYKIFNGMLGRLVEVEEIPPHHYESTINIDGENIPFNGLVSKHQFGQPKTISSDVDLERLNIKNLGLKELGTLFDWGYALTVHKAQGSEASIVIVFEERLPRYDEEMWRRWRYTAVTRSTDKLYIIA